MFTVQLNWFHKIYAMVCSFILQQFSLLIKLFQT